MFDMIVYASPEPHYVWEDLKLSFGNDRFREFEIWVEANVPRTRRLKDGVSVKDVDHYFMSRRKMVTR